MRVRYNRELRTIHDDLIRMGSRVEHALAHAMQALTTWDTVLAQQVIREDVLIDAARTALEERVLEVMAIQQPVVATDLRTLNATIAIANELERAGDYAKGIAKRVIRCLRAPVLIETPPKLHRMGELAQQMLHVSLDAFVRLDSDLARALAAQDDRVDQLEDEVTAELLHAAQQDPTRLACTICLLDVAHTFERLADRTTNIAERIVFIATNVTEELNA